MGTITRFEDIQAWQTARALTREIYQVSNQGAFARDFGLRDQLRRATVSIMSNPSTGSGHCTAEGFESQTQNHFIQYLGYVKASAGEVRAQLYVALDVGYLDRPQFEHLSDMADKCSRQLSNFITYLRTHPARQMTRENNVIYKVEEN